MTIARFAAELAPGILESFQLTVEKDLAALLADGWGLDYRSPVVRNLNEVCALHLRRRSPH